MENAFVDSIRYKLIELKRNKMAEGLISIWGLAENNIVQANVGACEAHILQGVATPKRPERRDDRVPTAEHLVV